MTVQEPNTTRSAEPSWLLYGANGYTGELIAREAVQRGLHPILAGRNPEDIQRLARELNCTFRIFDLNDTDRAADALQDIDVVLHCAGPFVRTAQPMLDACLASATHYMDITGEIPVLEAALARGNEAVSAGITVLPGTGYDVVPTDCLAAMLKKRLPDASRLQLAFCGKIYQSPGTWKSTLDSLPRCGAVRKNGVIQKVPHVWKMQRLQFDHDRCNTISIPWGDVSSAWYSTGIPDIEVYGGVPLFSACVMRVIRGVACSVMGNASVLQFSKNMVTRFVRGPNERQLREGEYHLRGDVWNDRGEQRTICMRTPEGYSCTVESTLAILPRMLGGQFPAGAWTPSQVLGSDFALSLKGIELREAPQASGD